MVVGIVLMQKGEPMDDLISRQAAIDAILAVTGNASVRELYEHVQEHGLSDMWSGGVNAAIDVIIAVPPAEPTQTQRRANADSTQNCALDCIDRQAAIDHWRSIIDATNGCDRYDMGFNDGLEFCISDLSTMPSAQPGIDEWCTDCKEYDTERHCCPRWSRVIRETLKDAQQERKTGRWVSVGCVVQNIANVPMIKCTVCGHLEPDVDAARTPYCSHCGSRMRGDSND